MTRIYTIFFAYISLMHDCSDSTFAPWSDSPIRLLDYSKKDLFFDRVVFLTLDVKNFSGDGRINKHVTTGVLITNDRVLTSYNAYRNLSTSVELLEKIFVCYVEARTVTPPYKTFYDYQCSKIACARPLVPMKDEELLPEQWHGPDKKHSPVHDLMVLRLEEKLQLWEPDVEEPYEIRHSEDVINNEIQKKAGPLLTKLCEPNSRMRKQIQFVSLGLTKSRVKRYFGLEIGEYEDSESVVMKCDEWVPRLWGHFICIANDDNRFGGFSSGSLLFSERILFGVGSFVIWRGKESVLVFTDIRPYLTHIAYTCTEHDLH